MILPAKATMSTLIVNKIMKSFIPFIKVNYNNNKHLRCVKTLNSTRVVSSFKTLRQDNDNNRSNHIMKQEEHPEVVFSFNNDNSDSSKFDHDLNLENQQIDIKDNTTDTTEVEPWIIKLREQFFCTAIVDQNENHVNRSVLIVFHDQDKCIAFKNKLVHFYRKSCGHWCNVCVSYNRNRNHACMILRTDDSLNREDGISNKNEDDLTKLKCLPMNANDDQFTYTLNLLTNFSCFVCQSFEADDDTMESVLSGFFIQLDEQLLTSMNPRYEEDRIYHIIDYMDEMYQYDI